MASASGNVDYTGDRLEYPIGRGVWQLFADTSMRLKVWNQFMSDERHHHGGAVQPQIVMVR